MAVQNLTIAFDTDDGYFKAVDDVSFQVHPGEVVGLVGESGCGKSVTALGLLRLVPIPPGRIEAGQIRFQGRDLLALAPSAMRQIRGNRISMVFQEPAAALSPLKRIGPQMIETLQLHQKMAKPRALESALAWMKRVGIAEARQRLNAYPYELSGGMQQRIMIAMALMLEPDLIIADEPTTALDVTIQAQIFELLQEMRRKESAVLLITHDMGVVWEVCDRILVMYASRIAEEGQLADIFERPAHPYTRGLLESIPSLTGTGGRLKAIEGQVPSPYHYPSGCHFRDRCRYAFEDCARERPPLKDLGGGHRAACLLAGQLK